MTGPTPRLSDKAQYTNKCKKILYITSCLGGENGPSKRKPKNFIGIDLDNMTLRFDNHNRLRMWFLRTLLKQDVAIIY